MEFAGNNYTYISKTKKQTYHDRKQNEQNNIKVINSGNEVKKGRIKENCKVTEKIKDYDNENECLFVKKERERSRSIEVVEEEDLDLQYSDDESISNLNEVKLKEESGNFHDIFNIPNPSIDNNINNNQIPKRIKEKKVLYNVNKKKRELKNFKHEVDTNIINFKFNFLKEKVSFATGDPYFCKNCQAILSKHSEINENEKVWKCEFCDTLNVLNNYVKEEKPTEECIDYFVDTKKKNTTSDEKTILYCFDTSGSMCVTEALAGNHKIKGNYLEKYKSDLMKFSDGSSQFYDGNMGGVTYVSRLQCLQAGIESYLSKMKNDCPKNKVGIITFSDGVVCYGDGSKTATKIEGNYLNEEQKIIEMAEKSQDSISKPISETSKNLIEKLYSIEESGRTALGPGILFSINLLNNAPVGSKIILCTDGLANIGIGGMEILANKKDKDFDINYQKIKSFYENLGNQAKSKGIIINLLTFSGEESNIEILSQLCDLTQGEVIRVKPTEILNEFANLMDNEILATDVSISVKLHKSFEFRNEKKDDLSRENSEFSRKVGIVSNESELCLEYRVKSNDELLKMNIDLDLIKEIFFQSIIRYTNLKGEECLRVTTKKQLISDESEKIIAQAKPEIISVNAIKKCSQLAKEGDYRESQSTAMAYKQMFKKNNHISSRVKENYQQFNNIMSEMNNNLQKLQFSEECDDDILMDSKEGKNMNQDKRIKNRMDEVSYNIHSNFNMNSEKLMKKKK